MLARGHPREELENALSQADPTILELELQRLGLLGLLGGRLVGELAERLDPRLIAAVERALALGRRDALSKQMLTWRLLQMLEGAGVTALPLKGPFLAERLHGDAGARISADIDILVGASQLRLAVAVLEQSGYVRPRLSDDLPRLHHIFELEGEPRVDLHWRIHWYEGTYAERLLQRSFREGDVRRPTPFDELVSLLLFYARDGFVGLRTPVDIGAWWLAHGDSVKSGEVQAVLADHPNLSPAVAAGSLAAERVLELPISSYLDGRSFARRRTIVAARLADWPAEHSDAQTDVALKLVDGLLTKRGDRWAFVQRAVFRDIPGPVLTAPVRRALYFLFLARHAGPVLIRLVSATGRLSGERASRALDRARHAVDT